MRASTGIRATGVRAMSTLIPLFVLAFLNAPADEVKSWLVPQENLICWQTVERGLCLPYNDEGTHLVILLNEEEV